MGKEKIPYLCRGFSENSPVRVNSKINLKKINLFIPKEGRKFSHLRMQKKETINVSKGSNTETNKSVSLGIQKQNNIKPTNQNNKYEFIDNTALKNIFDNYKLRDKQNRKLRNNEMSFSRSINNLISAKKSEEVININDGRRLRLCSRCMCRFGNRYNNIDYCAWK